MAHQSLSPIRIGLIGFGNIGTGVVRWLRANNEIIQSRLPRPIELARIADIDLERDRGIPVRREMLTRNAMDILNDPSIQIVIELVGGVDKARELVEGALRAGKHVVTANKALLATHGADLMALARGRGLVIGMEASVGAGIPVFRTLHHALAPNRFQRVAGIVNGTCNYILTEMERGGKPFQQVLAEAQKLGYAEPDPTFDIEGTDTAHKIAILSALAFGQDIRIGDVTVEGISRLKPEHLEWAAQQGFRIKLIATGREAANGQVEVWTAPTLVRADGALGSVMGVFNAFVFEGEPIGRTVVVGRGAGPESTSSGILSDVMAIAAAIDLGGLQGETMLSWPQGTKNVLPAGQSEGEFVLCLETSDASGGPGAVVAALEKASLPVRRVESRSATETPQGIKGSGLLFWAETAKTGLGQVRRAAETLAKSGVLRDLPVILRIEREL